MSEAAPRVRIIEVETFERDVRLRLPFRFGVMTLLEAPQAFVRVRLEGADGRTAIGCAAEMMVPKWFDKRPELTPQQNVEQLRHSIRTAAAAARVAPPASLFAAAQRNEAETVAALGAPRLVAGFGPALIARAALDACCRLEGLSFQEAIGRNLVGIGGAELPADLAAIDCTAVLGALRPREHIAARHTIGMLDPLTESEIGAPLDDGLPQSVEAVIARYGHRWFKIKLSGDIEADLDRLARIASVLDRSPGYGVTIDGNEQFAGVAPLAELLDRLERNPALGGLRRSIAYIEQPFSRAITLDTPLGALGTRVPFLIDESDDSDAAFSRATAMGYRGVSSKTCKGVYRSLLKAVRIRSGGERGLFLSGEDLTCQAGLSVQQDLALGQPPGARPCRAQRTPLCRWDAGGLGRGDGWLRRCPSRPLPARCDGAAPRHPRRPDRAALARRGGLCQRGNAGFQHHAPAGWGIVQETRQRGSSAMTTLSQSTRTKLLGVSVATLSTALFKRGLRNQTIQEVFPLAPKGRNLVGPAFTLRYIPAREDLNRLEVFRDPGHPQRAAVEACPPGAVLVMDSRKNPRAASAGSILVSRLMLRGVAGVVTDGGFRDSPEIARLDIAAYHNRPSAPTNLTLHQGDRRQPAHRLR